MYRLRVIIHFNLQSLRSLSLSLSLFVCISQLTTFFQGGHIWFNNENFYNVLEHYIVQTHKKRSQLINYSTHTKIYRTKKHFRFSVEMNDFRHIFQVLLVLSYELLTCFFVWINFFYYLFVWKKKKKATHIIERWTWLLAAFGTCIVYAPPLCLLIHKALIMGLFYI